MEEMLKANRVKLNEKYLELDLSKSPFEAGHIRGQMEAMDQVLGIVQKAVNFDFGDAQSRIDKQRKLLTAFRRE